MTGVDGTHTIWAVMEPPSDLGQSSQPHLLQTFCELNDLVAADGGKTKQKHPLVEVIMLSGHASVDSAVEGLKLGAFDYVTKPCDISDLLEKVNAAYARKHTAEDNIRKTKVDKTTRRPMAMFDEDEWG